MNTKAMHERFWRTMGERFGKRWLDEYGNEPTKAWKALIDRYTPDEVKAALELMGSKGWAHPPTEPQFESLLAEASKAAKADTQDWRRGYWRACIVNAVAAGMVQRGLISHPAEFEEFLVRHRHSLGAAMRNLLDDMDAMEQRTGQRTSGMERTCEERCREIVRRFTPAPQLEAVT